MQYADDAEEADHPHADPTPLAPDVSTTIWPELEALIGPGGKLQAALPGYERRAGQELMMRTIAHAFEHGEHVVVEAGTGIGKSLAYLLPAALSGLRVILSTGTRTLQDQLANRQVPFVRDVLGLPIEATVLKGRTNYLCLLLLETAKGNPDIRLDEHADLQRILAWAETTTTGDRAELRDLTEGSTAWRAVAADAERCLGRQCPHFADCHLMTARRRAEAADIVIVNHHLFFADLQLREGAKFALLPDAHAVVFDEAHHLEDIAAHAFGRSVSDARLRRLASDFRRAFRAAGRDSMRVEGPLAELDRDRERLWAFLAAERPRGRFQPERLPEAFREAWYKLDNTLVGLALLAGAEASTVVGAGPRELGLAESLRRLPDRIEELRADLLALLAPADRPHPDAGEEEVRWVDHGERAIFLRSAPIDVGGKLRETLFPRFRSVVFTSATLSAGQARTGSHFEHFRERLGLAPETRELALPSPFDYPRQALLYAPSDLPDPRSPAHAKALHARIAALVTLTKGRALLLFTSHNRMLEAHHALAPTWDHPTLVQGQGSKEALLHRFLEAPGTVLFATATFWEGVDIIGDALSLVVIDKLPFAAPGDPLVDARITNIGRRGGNAFMGYQVPTAILALKQGFGRLIRHRADRGIVAVLDPRLSTARYGRVFIESLPPARITGDFVELSRWWEELASNSGSVLP